ncbi:MAG TPA: hypothetical protein VGM51_16780 [Armatimonadota bacterium]|jgi:ABC-type nickel/cobalt efflux system permease component RcnA
MKLARICQITLLLTLSPIAAAAHPMGNFTINHYARLRVEKGSLRLRYVLDMAELPTMVERQVMDLNSDNDVSDAEVKSYIRSRTPRWLGNLPTSVDGTAVSWTLKGADARFTPGVANLATMKVELDAVAPLRPGIHRIEFKDANYPERPGWKEMVVEAATGIPPIAGNTLNKEISRELRAYPPDRLSNPPQDSSADFTVNIPAAPPAPKPVQRIAATPAPVKHATVSTPPVAVPWAPLIDVPGIDTSPAPKATASLKPTTKVRPAPAPGARPAPAAVALPAPAPTQPPVASAAPPPSRWARAFHSLVAVKRITPAVLLMSLLIAFCLGGIHALQPGHGKTLVAAYLVGQRGTARHAILLGITVTLSHTFGVFLLGAVALYGSQFVLPEVLQPWLGVASGVLVALIGGGMLLARLREIGRERAHSAAHSHHGEHTQHHHHDHAVTHSHGVGGEHTHSVPNSITVGSLLALGISGGIVPCPDALIVLLGAIAIHQTLYGMALIVAFSAGLAVTLTAAGLAVVWGQQRTPLARLTPRGVRAVSIVGNAIVLAIGIALALQSLAATRVLTGRG